MKHRQSLLAATLAVVVLLGCNQRTPNTDKHSAFDRFEDNSVTQPKSIAEPNGKLELSAKRGTLATLSESKVVSQKFFRCGRTRVTCVVDGDTIWLNGVKIRVADIDTPEISQPKCSYEKALGDQATERLVELINDGPFQIVTAGDRDQDRYGRKLRTLVRGGNSIGMQLVREGLARAWTGRQEPWC